MKITKHEIDTRIDTLYTLFISTYGMKVAIKIVDGVKRKLMDEKKRRKSLEE